MEPDALALGVALTLCVVAFGYFAFAVFAARDFFSRPRPVDPGFHPPVSILKPLFGLDTDAERSLTSFFRLDYPKYEMVFAAASDRDPAVALARRLLREFPHVDARVAIAPATREGSPKVANLVHAAALAKYPLLLVSDADIRVSPGHVRRMVQPLSDPGVGVVTCLYRSEGRGFVGRMDALGLSTEFQREVLVARKVEGISFAMGSGILLRRRVLDEIGGFEAVSNFLADDFRLGNAPARNGHRVELADEVVDHVLSTRTTTELVRHQLRWNRGIRVSRPGGYAGLVVTHGICLGLLFLAMDRGHLLGWGVLAALVAARLSSAWIVSGRWLGDSASRRFLWLVPLRDALSFALWLGGFFGSTVVWRGQRFRLGRNGELSSARSPSLTPSARARSTSASPRRARKTG